MIGLHPVRALVFWTGFLAVQIAATLFEILAIGIPVRIVPALRRGYRRDAWNFIIGWWGRWSWRVAKVGMGLIVEVKGAIPPGRFLVVANHQSTGDIPLLFDVLQAVNLKFVAKKELHQGLPPVSWALRYGGHGIVDFDNPRRSLRDLLVFAREMERWEGCPVIFPEGRRTEDGQIGPFHASGLRAVARESRLPVVPVVIDGLWRARSMGDFFRYLPGARCTVSILPAVPSEEASAEGFAPRLQEIMRAELERLRILAAAP